ncbi:MAG: OmpA family protein [Candidatus Eisenbacteria bacterium]|uniref:OmpA family protein n=1 Tax=Eiseniibacteriota bacterium TaxID=2212470 RepID=A0A956NCT7_UNCEI|nr:OmpA family protein [Candidatus Eisenbacteria bacterium]
MQDYPFRRPRVEEGAPAWAMTYGDLMSLLLVFFVLIASYSTLDVVKYRSLVGSVQSALGTRDRTLDNPQLDSSPTSGIASAAEERERRWVEKEVEALVQEIGGPLSAKMTDDGLRVRIDGQLLFDPGKADLRGEALEVIARLVPALERYPYELQIEGHTDDVPISNATFPSNWELSAARAARVVRYLRENTGLDGKQLLAIGYADTRPLRPNDTDENRSMNRRVELLLATPKGSPPPAWIEDPIGPMLPSIEAAPGSGDGSGAAPAGGSGNTLGTLSSDVLGAGAADPRSGVSENPEVGSTPTGPERS